MWDLPLVQWMGEHINQYTGWPAVLINGRLDIYIPYRSQFSQDEMFACRTF